MAQARGDSIHGKFTLVAPSVYFSVFSCVSSGRLTSLSSESLLEEWITLYKLGMMESQPLRRPEGQTFRVILCYIVSSQGPAWAADPVSKKRKGKEKKAETWLYLQAFLSCPPSILPLLEAFVGWGRKESQGGSQPGAMVYISVLLLIGLWGLVCSTTSPSPPVGPWHSA